MPPHDSARSDTNAKTAQMVELISEIGPDIPEISRRLGQFKESVRYRYKEKILRRGLAVQAVVDHEKLGLKQLEVIADFAPEFEEYAQSILAALSDIFYVTSFEKLFPKGQYLIGAAVPGEFVTDWVRFVNDLRWKKGLLTSVEVHEFDWFRRVPMRTQFYDFGQGRWDYDWPDQAAGDTKTAAYFPSSKGKFDSTDLLILKELYIDASRSLVEIAGKLRENYKRLAWHYSTHVLASKMIKGFSLRWPGTRYDPKIERALHRQHRYFGIDLIAKNLSKVERMELMSNTNRLPFLWSEAGGERDYFAQLAFPADFFTEAMQRMEEVVRPVKDRTDLYQPDMTKALAFTISYRLYDQQAKRWTLDMPMLQNKFDELILKIKEKRG